MAEMETIILELDTWKSRNGTEAFFPLQMNQW